ncbi:MBL fold metallo-hydrolase [Plantactinospora endophytica]|uniref:MBL fold metallo-hydrolase n=1 Tax=Plantactinospora endophytica TaxID=673535 RepID=A0ABQ4DRT4_9ACTN|nr:MBL fold metallo-hydrolase [Plantactinospora endophytica]GIG85180.1 MBL fold metallo-hydrolase [Plantactinospora endophytica]
MTGHVTAPAAALADQLPSWATLVRAPNPGPMTLDGTNTWVLGVPGSGEVVVVDPGPLDEAHLAAVAARGPVAGVLVTHGHPDHAEGLDRFLELTGAEPLVFRCAWSTIELAGLRIRLLVTPGHTADSLCFVVERADGPVEDAGEFPVEPGGERAVFTGDTILGRGTTVVAHPDGDLADYLASLETLTEFSGVPALPGHGPPLADCAAAARFYLAHRRARLEQVRAAVRQGARTAPEVVAAVYADVDRSLWGAAEWSVRAQLAYLDHENRESGPGAGGLDSP